ncbi:MAG: cytochrome c oxidase subunit 4 [Lapillicoccus sp.]
MKVETKLFVIMAIFFVPLVPIYGYFTHWQEMVGTVGFLLTALLFGLIGFYLWATGRKFRDRPEDDPSAPISAQEGDYGFFSPYSWWPMWLGMSAAVCFAGLAVGWWLFIIGAFVGSVALVGWTFEYFKGEYAN